MYSKTTYGVTVTVTPYFLDDQSSHQEGHYVWAYQVNIKNSSSKKMVNPPNKTTATHPAAAIIGIFLNQYQERISENKVLATKIAVPAIIP